MEHIRPGALFNFESEYGDQENPIYSYTKSRSQNRIPFCTAAQNYEMVLTSISSKDVGLLWYHQMLERIMGNYHLKLPYILRRSPIIPKFPGTLEMAPKVTINSLSLQD